jgi:hypothetical protein
MHHPSKLSTNWFRTQVILNKSIYLIYNSQYGTMPALAFRCNAKNCKKWSEYRLRFYKEGKLFYTHLKNKKTNKTQNALFRHQGIPTFIFHQYSILKVTIENRRKVGFNAALVISFSIYSYIFRRKKLIYTSINLGK